MKETWKTEETGQMEETGHVEEESFQRYNIFRLNLEYYFLFIIVLVLSILGIIMVSSSSVAVGDMYFNDPYWFVRRQVIWWVISFIVFIITSKINYRFYSKISVIFILVSIALLAIVLIPGVSPVIGESRRWINLFFFNFQPSEVTKLALIIFISDSLNKRYNDKPVMKNILWPSFVALAVVTLLIFLEPDFGTVIIIWVAVFILFFIGNTRFPHMLSLGALGLVTLVAYMLMADYRRERIFAWLNKSDVATASGANFQVNQSLIALGSGHLFGLGLGNSIQKYSYLPEAHSDFIFAILGEEAGLVGTLVLILLFLAFVFFGIRVCLKTKDYFGRTLAGTITGMIAAQAIINICVVIGVLPVTGLTLPFLSSGGTSLLVSMASAGIILNIARQNFTLLKKSDNEMGGALKDDGK